MIKTNWTNTNWTLTAAVISLILCLPAWAQETNDDSWRKVSDPETPKIAAASNEGELAIQGFKIPQGWTAKLYAAEPDVANPVAFDVDFQGRVFVIESFRQEKGVEDNRSHRAWLIDDLAAQTIHDRLAYIKKHLKEKAVDYTKQDDRIRLLQDTNGDGRADKSSIYSDKYNTILSGSGAGVLSYRGNVYFTCIPDLFLLRDLNNDGTADSRLVLSSGYGVRFAFRGHDLHGLIVGPDGRLYFSIGDRGYNVRKRVIDIEGEKKVVEGFSDPASGAVFRCELDGSNLEVFATGMRNPQELAFDNFGNLFTGDNNSDSGDKARWVYVVEGGDSGWRMYYQYLPDRGPFNREKIWHPYHAETPAYIVPPVTNLADGPSGLAFYPGTGLSKHFRDRFFLCDFRGQSSNSGIRTFRVKPKGAFFEVVDMETSIWNLLATDIQFGPDGKVYASDWVHGWQGLGKGRLYTFSDGNSDQKVSAEVAMQLKRGFKSETVERLEEMLSHPDRRIRQEVQFELVARQQTDVLFRLARDSKHLLARLHSIWGLAQYHRLARFPKDRPKSEFLRKWDQLLLSLIESSNPEIRAQAAKMITETDRGSQFGKSWMKQYSKLLQDENLRVVYFALKGLGSFPFDTSDLICQVAERNAGKDPMIRHAAIFAVSSAQALRTTTDDSTTVPIRRPQIPQLLKHDSAEVRRVGIVAAGKTSDQVESIWDAIYPAIGQLLKDENELVALEAARFSYENDRANADLQQRLADRIIDVTRSDAFIRRSIAANFRLGKVQQARALAAFAANEVAPLARRIEALDLLGRWSAELKLDSVTGKYWPIGKRDPQVARNAVQDHLESLLKGPLPLVNKCVNVCTKLKVVEIEKYLVSIVGNDQADIQLRSNSLYGLFQLKKCPPEMIQQAAASQHWTLKTTALDLLIQTKSESATDLFQQVISQAPLESQQKAWRLAAKLSDAKSAESLVKALENLQADREPNVDAKIDSVALDIIAGARGRKEANIVASLKLVRQKIRTLAVPIDRHRFSKNGGNVKRGERIFYERTEVSCLRCHKIGLSGGEVGPDLTKIGSDKDGNYLLESIVDPNKTIAKDFETVIILDLDGESHTGIIKQETDEFVELMDADGITTRIRSEDVDDIQKGNSAMPEDAVQKLTAEEIRDLMAFLKQLKGQDAGKKRGQSN